MWCITVILLVFGTCDAAFADGEKLITGVYPLCGELYFCDTAAQTAVIRNVTPVSEKDAEAAKAAEYNEIRIAADGVYMNDGSKLPLEYMNSYTDSRVWFIAAAAADGSLIIPYLRFR